MALLLMADRGSLQETDDLVCGEHVPPALGTPPGRPAKPVEKPPKKTTPTGPIPVPMGITNQQVINAFHQVSLKLGMGNWA